MTPRLQKMRPGPSTISCAALFQRHNRPFSGIFPPFIHMQDIRHALFIHIGRCAGSPPYPHVYPQFPSFWAFRRWITRKRGVESSRGHPPFAVENPRRARLAPHFPPGIRDRVRFFLQSRSARLRAAFRRAYPFRFSSKCRFQQHGYLKSARFLDGSALL